MINQPICGSWKIIWWLPWQYHLDILMSRTPGLKARRHFVGMILMATILGMGWIIEPVGSQCSLLNLSMCCLSSRCKTWGPGLLGGSSLCYLSTSHRCLSPAMAHTFKRSRCTVKRHEFWWHAGAPQALSELQVIQVPKRSGSVGPHQGSYGKKKQVLEAKKTGQKCCDQSPALIDFVSSVDVLDLTLVEPGEVHGENDYVGIGAK